MTTADVNNQRPRSARGARSQNVDQVQNDVQADDRFADYEASGIDVDELMAAGAVGQEAPGVNGTTSETVANVEPEALTEPMERHETARGPRRVIEDDAVDTEAPVTQTVDTEAESANTTETQVLDAEPMSAELATQPSRDLQTQAGSQRKGNPMRTREWSDKFESMNESTQDDLCGVDEGIKNVKSTYSKSFTDSKTNPFVGNKSREERKKGIDEAKLKMRKDMVSIIVNPLERGVDFNAVANVATTAGVMLLLSPHFRDMVLPDIKQKTSDFLNEVRENMVSKGKSASFFAGVKERGKAMLDNHKLVKMFDTRRTAMETATDHIPDDVDTAALTLVGLNNSAYEAMRYGEEPNKVAKQYIETVSDMEKEWKRDGVDKGAVHSRAYDIVAERIAVDPGYAARFNQTAYGAMRPEVAREGRDGVSRYGGGWLRMSDNGVLNKKGEFFSPRMPMSPEEHMKSIGSALASDVMRVGIRRGDVDALHTTLVGYMAALEDPAALALSENGVFGEPGDPTTAAHQHGRSMFQGLIEDGYSQQDAAQIMSESYGYALESLNQAEPDMMSDYREKYPPEVMSEHVTALNEKLVGQHGHVFPASFDVEQAQQARHEIAQSQQNAELESAQTQQTDKKKLNMKNKSSNIRTVQQSQRVAAQEAQAVSARKQFESTECHGDHSHSGENKPRPVATRHLGSGLDATRVKQDAVKDEASATQSSQARDEHEEPVRDRGEDRPRNAEAKVATRSLAQTTHEEHVFPKVDAHTLDETVRDERAADNNVTQVNPSTQTPAQRNEAESYNSDYARTAQTGTSGGVKISFDYDDPSTSETEEKGVVGKRQSSSGAVSRRQQRVLAQETSIEEEQQRKKAEAVEFGMG